MRCLATPSCDDNLSSKDDTSSFPPAALSDPLPVDPIFTCCNAIHNLNGGEPNHAGHESNTTPRHRDDNSNAIRVSL